MPLSLFFPAVLERQFARGSTKWLSISIRYSRRLLCNLSTADVATSSRKGTNHIGFYPSLALSNCLSSQFHARAATNAFGTYLWIAVAQLPVRSINFELKFDAHEIIIRNNLKFLAAIKIYFTLINFVWLISTICENFLICDWKFQLIFFLESNIPRRYNRNAIHSRALQLVNSTEQTANNFCAVDSERNGIWSLVEHETRTTYVGARLCARQTERLARSCQYS